MGERERVRQKGIPGIAGIPFFYFANPPLPALIKRAWGIRKGVNLLSNLKVFVYDKEIHGEQASSKSEKNSRC
jgi:hypothetical protein